MTPDLRSWENLVVWVSERTNVGRVDVANVFHAVLDYCDARPDLCHALITNQLKKKNDG